MTEDQKKWLLDLQAKGVRFEWYRRKTGEWLSKNVRGGEIIFNSFEELRIPAQSAPDIPDWQMVCIDMYAKGVKFEMYNTYTGQWINAVGLFDSSVKKYRIPEQPIPEWKEPEMTEEANQEIPHRDLQIQWHEDWIHALKTGEEMREWQYRFVRFDAVSDWHTFKLIESPAWSNEVEYRRKPRTVTYWHCVTEYEGMYVLIRSFEGVDSLQKIVDQNKSRNSTTKFSQIIETTVEMED